MPKVTYSNGQTLEVHYPPPFPMWEDLPDLAQYKVLAEDSNQEAMAKGEALDQARKRYALKYAFRELAVPDEWTFPEAAWSEGLEPSSGDQGRLLDYVRHEFLRTPGDIEQTNEVLAYAQPLTNEEVAAARTLFPGLRRFLSNRRRETSA